MSRVPWPAGQPGTLDRFLRAAQSVDGLDGIRRHPELARVLAFAPYDFDGASVGQILTAATNVEQAEALPTAWEHWQTSVPESTAADFAEAMSQVTDTHWHSFEDAISADERFRTLITAASSARTKGESVPEAFDSLAATFAGTNP